MLSESIGELFSCAEFHRGIADNFKYGATIDDPVAELWAQQMTDILRWRHNRWAEALKLCAERLEMGKTE